LVRSFYYVEFDQQQENNSGVVIDDACYELMFVKETDVQIITGDNQVFNIPPSYTLNNLEGPFKFKFSETFSSFCIKLQPWMNNSFVNYEKSEVLDLNKIYPSALNDLHLQIFSSETFEEMQSHAEDFLELIDIKSNEATKLVKGICELIYEKDGNISVNEISEQFSIYRQKLNQLFKQEVKYTLKSFINYVRIRACLNHKIKNPTISLTEIGYHFGFYDQAHFIRCFKNACGVTPSEYIKNPGYSFKALPS